MIRNANTMQTYALLDRIESGISTGVLLPVIIMWTP